MLRTVTRHSKRYILFMKEEQLHMYSSCTLLFSLKIKYLRCTCAYIFNWNSFIFVTILNIASWEYIMISLTILSFLGSANVCVSTPCAGKSSHLWKIRSCKYRATPLDSKWDHVRYWHTVGPFAQAIQDTPALADKLMLLMRPFYKVTCPSEIGKWLHLAWRIQGSKGASTQSLMIEHGPCPRRGSHLFSLSLAILH